MKTIVYVDGFNLYYCALKKSKYKWLNLEALVEAVLPSNCHVSKINYYTARVSGRGDPSSPKDQNTYLKALATSTKLQIHFGNFQIATKWMFLAQPVRFRPASTTSAVPNPVFAQVVKTEEKGSDVNLGAHLVRDAFSGTLEHAAVLTNDTDLKEPLRIVAQETGLPITLLAPVAQPSSDLKRFSSHVRHIRPYLGVCQFPDPICCADGSGLAKPADW